MAKKRKKQELNIRDFFGNYNTYRIFALRSGMPVLNFANKLSKILNIAFSALPDFHYVSKKLSAHFAVYYAEYAQQESIHYLLLENRTKTNQQELFSPKTGKQSHLLNYSLFEDSLYLFNNNLINGYYCLESKFGDIDYLLLLYTKKDIETEFFSKFLKTISPFNPEDVSYTLEREQTLAEKENAFTLKDFLCTYEVNANLYSRRKKFGLLGPVKQIPKQNLQFPIPIHLENNVLQDSLQFSEEYLALLAEE